MSLPTNTVPIVDWNALCWWPKQFLENPTEWERAVSLGHHLLLEVHVAVQIGLPNMFFLLKIIIFEPIPNQINCLG